MQQQTGTQNRAGAHLHPPRHRSNSSTGLSGHTENVQSCLFGAEKPWLTHTCQVCYCDQTDASGSNTQTHQFLCFICQKKKSLFHHPGRMSETSMRFWASSGFVFQSRWVLLLMCLQARERDLTHETDLSRPKEETTPAGWPPEEFSIFAPLLLHTIARRSEDHQSVPLTGPQNNLSTPNVHSSPPCQIKWNASLETSWPNTGHWAHGGNNYPFTIYLWCIYPPRLLVVFKPAVPLSLTL